MSALATGRLVIVFVAKTSASRSKCPSRDSHDFGSVFGSSFVASVRLLWKVFLHQRWAIIYFSASVSNRPFYVSFGCEQHFIDLLTNTCCPSCCICLFYGFQPTIDKRWPSGRTSALCDTSCVSNRVCWAFPPPAQLTIKRNETANFDSFRFHRPMLFDFFSLFY